MTNYFRAGIIAAMGAWTCLASFTVRAQDPQTANSYDSGVNAYFAGRFREAESFLSRAIEFNSPDPRAYYFRAFSLLRQGRGDEARSDMHTGALLEAQQPHRFAIGSALERVQGPDRLMLEEIRRNARGNSATRSPATAIVPAQHQTIREVDAGVLRERLVIPLEELLRPSGPKSIAVEQASEPPVIPPQAIAPAAKPPEQPAAKPGTTEAEANPFEDDSERAAPTAAPPVKTPPQETAKPAPPANPPVEAEENPFNG